MVPAKLTSWDSSEVQPCSGVDSKPQALIKPTPLTKLHQFRMVQTGNKELLAVSTEDGRILFFDLTTTIISTGGKDDLPQCACVAQLGGRDAGVSGRVKDFELLTLQADEPPAQPVLLVVSASSDGAIRLWRVAYTFASVKSDEKAPQQVGDPIATLETGNRITCMGAFVLDGKADGKVVDEDDGVGLGAEEGMESGSGEDE